MVTLHNVCAVHWGGVQYTGESSVHWGISLSTPGGVQYTRGHIMSTLGGVQYTGAHHEYTGGIS